MAALVSLSHEVNRGSLPHGAAAVSLPEVFREGRYWCGDPANPDASPSSQL